MKIYTTEQIMNACRAGEINKHDTQHLCTMLEEMYPNGAVSPAMKLAGKLAIAARRVFEANDIVHALENLETAFNAYDDEIMKNVK